MAATSVLICSRFIAPAAHPSAKAVSRYGIVTARSFWSSPGFPLIRRRKPARANREMPLISGRKAVNDYLALTWDGFRRFAIKAGLSKSKNIFNIPPTVYG
jgi:hypothetical protein